MQPIPLTLDSSSPKKFALWQLGFRPFFLAAVLWAIVAVGLWVAFWPGWAQAPLLGLAPMDWHAHEMVFGYASAVIAGFLLTAVRNWTGVQTWQGWRLALLLALWLMARLGMLLGGQQAVVWVAAADLLFMALLIVAVSLPVIRVRQWKHFGLIAKLVLILAGNAVFYLGAAGVVSQGVRWGVFSGLYFVLALIFVMGRRVIPFFIEKGVEDANVSLKNYRWLDVSSLILFLLFWWFDTFQPGSDAVVMALSVALFLLHGFRLLGWWHRGIWAKPLLWVLYLGYAFLVAGFALKALAGLAGISPFLALHAFAYGGIGMITAGMMARVSLGHTGRNVFQPPAIVGPMFALLLAGTVVRVVLPLFFGGHYALWILISQLLWIAAFCLFVTYYLPIFLRPRIDGRPG